MTGNIMLYTYKAKCVNVVDGDTIDCEIDLGFHMKSTLRLRLLGIDAPELRSEDPAIKASAQKSKIELGYMVNDKDLTIQTYKSDSFGRWLTLISCQHLGEWISVNKTMIDKGLAVEWVKK